MKKNFRKHRDESITLQLELDANDKILGAVSRENGVFWITKNKILCVRSPDHLDPELKHPSAPWEQSLFLPHGYSDPIVARTIIQTDQLTEIFFSQNSQKRKELSDISWEVMNSLISLRFIKDRLEKQIEDIINIVEKDLNLYTEGNSPKPLPIVEYYDIEFRSFVNEVKRTLNTISDLFLPLTGQLFKKAHFHTAQKWAETTRGKNSLLSQMLKDDLRWIESWIDIRNALEHPEKDRYIETSNFALEADRKVRLPTWRFIHPDYDMNRPQNLLEVFEICIENLLKFYEDLLVTLLDGHLPEQVKIIFEIIPEDQRDKDFPMRYKICATVVQSNPTTP